METAVLILIALVALAALAVALLALRRKNDGPDPLEGLARELAALKGELAAAAGITNQRLQTITDKVAVIDSARGHIEELAKQVVGLNRVFSDKQARGAFGQFQMEELVRDILPEAAYELQATLSSGKRVDCLIRLPRPPGPVGVDAKFPLESFRAIQAAADEAARVKARRQFSIDVSKHVGDIAEKYIVRGETAEWALMFVPSEAVYAEIHANFPNVVEESHRNRVGIVSPSTLMAVLTTVRAVVMDAQMVERAEQIKAAIAALAEDAGRLADRADTLQGTTEKLGKDLRELGISAGKVARKISDISRLDLSATTDGGS
ncbi:MAG: DNA recombination protein RmuC [Alphaproteobacteria bacterium]|nr:DNA recombination protein RmuC [Alphaproteobacteria bacterium]